MESVKIGSKGLIKKHEFIRIIVQCMNSLGYVESAVCLESESGVSYKSADFESLESQILNANWNECVASLNKIIDLSDETRASALFLVFKQSLLECSSQGDGALALEILRKQVTGLQIGEEKVRNLALGLLSSRDLGLSKVDSAAIREFRKKLLMDLEKLLPPPLTVPERRLEELVERAVIAQIDNCTYHTSDTMSLYEDHHCSRGHFPTKTVQVD